MSDNAMRVTPRSLKEQFSRSSEAWQEQSDPIFRFWAEGDWWGFPFFSLSAGRYFGEQETLCLYWPLGTLVIKETSANVEVSRFMRFTKTEEAREMLERALNGDDEITVRDLRSAKCPLAGMSFPLCRMASSGGTFVQRLISANMQVSP